MIIWEIFVILQGTALHLAVQTGNSKVVEILMKNGADAIQCWDLDKRSKDHDYLFPLELAIILKKKYELKNFTSIMNDVIIPCSDMVKAMLLIRPGNYYRVLCMSFSTQWKCHTALILFSSLRIYKSAKASGILWVIFLVTWSLVSMESLNCSHWQLIHWTILVPT